MIFVSSATLIAANGLYLLTIIADTASDLPAGDTVQVGNVVYEIAPGSTGIATDTGKKYMRTPSGTWAEQPGTGDITINLPDVYSEDEVDALLEPITDDIDDIQALDTKQNAALTHLINTGSKNYMSVTSGGVTSGRWVDIPVNIPAGSYKVSFSNVTSTDTDSTTCQILFFDSAFAQVSNTVQMPRGNNVSSTATLSAQATVMRIYSASSYAYSAGDTMTYTNGMVCAQSVWNISETYEPYCRTIPEIDALVNDIQTLDTKQTLALVHLINENGKNKVNPTVTTQTVNGITWTVNTDGTITASGTATANSYITVQVLPADSVFDGNYFLTGCPSGGSASTYALYVARGSYTKYDYGSGVVLSSNTDGLNKNLIAIVYSGQTVTDLVFQPMICKKVYWDITNKFVPYCPTLPELYAMIQ